MRTQSHHSIMLYRGCPGLYNRLYNEGAQEVRGDNLKLGGVLHNIINTYIKHCESFGLKFDLDHLDHITKEEFAKSDLSPAYYEDLATAAGIFANSYEVRPGLIWGTEFELKDVSICGEFPFTGRIDLLEAEGDRAIITDWKSSWQIMTDSEIEADWQLPLYAIGISQIFPDFTEFELRHYFVRFCAEKVRVMTKAQLNQIEGILFHVMREIACDTEFPFRPGSACLHCGLTHQCKEFEKFQPPAIPESQEAAAVIAAEILALEAQEKQRKDLLKKFCAVAGPVKTGGQVFGHFDQEEREWDVKGVFERLPADDFFAVAKISNTMMDKLMSKPVSPDPSIKNLVRESTKTSFRHKKAGM